MTREDLARGFGYSRGDTDMPTTSSLPAGVDGYAITSPRRARLQTTQPTPTRPDLPGNPPPPPTQPDLPRNPPSPLTPPHGPCHQPRSLHLLMRAVA